MTLTDAMEKDTDFIERAEELCFSKNPWKRGDIGYFIKQDYAYCRVCEEGYLISRILGDEAELLRIGVLPQYRRRGAGRRLLLDLVDVCSRHGVCSIYLEVRSSNTAAQRLYDSEGFVCLGVRQGYYGDEDARIYLLKL